MRRVCGIATCLLYTSSRYGGRGLAIGGMVLGTITFLASLIFALIAIVAN